MSPAQIKEYNKISKMLYRQQLRYVDKMLGKIFDVLRDKKILDNTIVILYSNHGDGLYDNKIPNHGVSYQSCVSVPLFIRHPKSLKTIKVKSPISSIDLVPTVLDILDIEVAHKVDGVSLLETIRTGVYPNEYIFGVDKESKYIRHKNYKLIIWPDRSKELFDLNADHGETSNLVDKFPDIVKLLEERLIDHETEQLELAFELLSEFKK
jgi:arylsulfatase A-like enzyme